MRAVAATCSDSETWASGRILVGPGLSGFQSPSASMCHRWLFGAGTSLNSSVSYLPDRNRADSRDTNLGRSAAARSNSRVSENQLWYRMYERSEAHTSELQSIMRISS